VVRHRNYGLIANVLWIVAIAVYAASFFLPAFTVVVGEESSTEKGYLAFILSWEAACDPLIGGIRVGASCLANPAMWCACLWLLSGRSKWACIAGASATALSTSLLIGNYDLDGLLIGYYLWVASMGLITLAAGAKWASQSKLRGRRARSRA
jgi:hypothetical protein